MEIVRLPVVSHIILNACAKSVVESMAKGIVAVANLGGILIELNHVLHDSVSVTHPEMFEGIFGISDGIEGTKVGSEFLKEGSVGILPCRRIPQIRAEDVWFKPVESSAREEGNGVVDFVGIRHKCSGSVIKVQLEGHNESLEFPWVGAIESIGSLTLVQTLLGRGLFNEVENSAQQIHEFPQEILLVGGVVARSAGTSGTIGTSRTSRPTRAAWSPGSIRASGFVRNAWLGVVILVTLVVSVCSVSRGIGFASGIIRFRGGRLPPIGCGLRCWGVWVRIFPVSIKYTGPSVSWKFIGWRSTKRIWSTVGVGLSCSEARVIVGLPTGWLSSNGGRSKKFWVFL